MESAFIPALRFHFLTPLFDSFMTAVLPDRRIKEAVVDRARLGNGQRVLDFGCGTATLTVLIKRRFPGALVRGLDIDDGILALARRKAEAQGADLGFDRYDGGRFPYPDASFDRVVTCFVLHHLDNRDKKNALREMFRVLRPGGELSAADFDRARNPVRRLAFGVVRLTDSRRSTRANAEGRVPDMIQAVGFEQVEERARFATMIGDVTCIRGVKQRAG